MPCSSNYSITTNILSHDILSSHTNFTIFTFFKRTRLATNNLERVPYWNGSLQTDPKTNPNPNTNHIQLFYAFLSTVP